MIILRLYRRRVDLGMKSAAGQTDEVNFGALAKSEVLPVAPLNWTNVPAAGVTDDGGDALYRTTIAAARLHAVMCAIAGSLFAMLLAFALYAAFSQTQINFLHAAKHAFQLFCLVWTFAWPAVLTVN